MIAMKQGAENADAQRAMGQLLMQNCTGLQDKDAAVGWLTRAAAGNVPAEVQLGHAYRLGQDDAKAFALYSQAAATANPVAQITPSASITADAWVKSGRRFYRLTIGRCLRAHAAPVLLRFGHAETQSPRSLSCRR